jgi:lipid A disaccharide synthetase
VLGKRLGYRTVIYAEWEPRWLRWIDQFGVMRSQTVTAVPGKYAHKVTVVGDLMAEVAADQSDAVSQRPEVPNDQPAANVWLEPGAELIGILPGSKAAKLAQGVPLMLAIAEQVHHARPQTRFVIPVAPTLELSTLAQFADPVQNPIVALVGGVTASLQQPSSGLPYLETQNGLRVDLWITPPGVARTPPYGLLKQCHLCLTTVGANTAELAALAVPMVVILPTQQLDAMRAWNGIPGLLANLPGLGSGFAKLINGWALRRVGLLAWPNIWAKAAIVPELVGRLEAKTVAATMVDYLAHPEKLQDMQARLRQVRGAPGAAQKLTQIVKEEIEASRKS